MVLLSCVKADINSAVGKSRLFGALLGGLFGTLASFGAYRLAGGLVASAALSAAVVPGMVYDLGDILQRVDSVTKAWSLSARQLAICNSVGAKVVFSIPTILEPDFCAPSMLTRFSYAFASELHGFDQGLFVVWDPGPVLLFVFLAIGFGLAAVAGFLLAEWTHRYYEKQAQIKVDAALGRVAGQVAHDIRSPLGALNVFLAEVKSGGEITPDAIEIGTLASARIMKIADDLLKFRREKAEAPEKPRNEVSDLVWIAQSIVEERSAQLRHQNQEILFVNELGERPGGDRPPLVIARSADLLRALDNLIGNSIEANRQSAEKCSERPPAKVTVSVSADPSNRDRIRLSVRDQGPGFPAAVLKDFKRRRKTQSTAKENGNGIGLATARSWVESWGGQMTIGSAPTGKDGGSWVELSLRTANPGRRG